MISSVTPAEWLLGAVVGIGLLVVILLITAPFADVFKKKS